MATQQTGKPSQQHKIPRFPGWLRFVFIGLGLICLGILAFIWIKGVGSDLDKVMTAIFVSLTAMFAFLAMPFLYHSEHSQSPDSSASPVSTPFPPIQINVNQIQSNAQQPSFTPTPTTPNAGSRDLYDQATVSNTGSQAMQQQSSDNAPIVNPPLSPAPAPSPSAQGNDPSSIDRNDLLDLLRYCPPSIFRTIVDYLKPPPGVLSSDRVPQSDRAGELIAWAEVNPPGPGLEAVYQFYEQAMGMGKKKSI